MTKPDPSGEMRPSLGLVSTRLPRVARHLEFKMLPKIEPGREDESDSGEELEALTTLVQETGQPGKGGEKGVQVTPLPLVGKTGMFMRHCC